METDPTALKLIALLQSDLRKLFRMRFGEVLNALCHKYERWYEWRCRYEYEYDYKYGIEIEEKEDVFFSSDSFTTQHDTTQHHTTQHNTTLHYTTLHYTTQHNTTQHNTILHNTTHWEAVMGLSYCINIVFFTKFLISNISEKNYLKFSKLC